MCKPFKFFQHVIDHPQYLILVGNASNTILILGSNQFKLMRSLKLLKLVMCCLNKTHLNGISQKEKEQAHIVSDL